MKISALFPLTLTVLLLAAQSVLAATVAAPKVTITSPKAGAMVTTSNLTLIGTATAGAGVYSVQVTWNNSDPGTASTTNNFKTWSFVVPLVPGTNVIQATAVDTRGTNSAPVAVKVFYVVLAPLTVQVNPSGAGSVTITPKATDGSLPIGENVTLAATAAKGFAFTNWSGNFSTNKSSVKFLMATGIAEVANFIDISRPVCAILSPTAGLKTTAQSFTIGGKASDNVGVTCVFYSLNNSDWQLATTANGWTNWSASVTLNAGANVIQAFATDAANNCSLTNKVAFTYLAPSVVGAWNAIQFRTPAQMNFDSNGVSGGEQFDLKTGSANLAASGAISGSLGRSFTGSYQVNGGMVDLIITNTDGVSEHSLFLNFDKDFMTSIESNYNPPSDNEQSLDLFVRAPASAADADLAGDWNATKFKTPAQITFSGTNGLNGGDIFGLGTGSATVAANGTLSVVMGEGLQTGTLSIKGGGSVSITVSNQSHNFYLNASKDLLVGSDTNGNKQELLIFQRAPASISTNDVVGTWNAVQIHTPAQISYDPINGYSGSDFKVSTGYLTINADGTFTAQIGSDSPATGYFTVLGPGQITINIDGGGSQTAFINAGKDVLVTSDSGFGSGDNHQEMIIFERAPSTPVTTAK